MIILKMDQLDQLSLTLSCKCNGSSTNFILPLGIHMFDFISMNT